MSEQMDLFDLYERGTTWTKSKIEGATDKLDAQSACDEWNVRDVMNHIIDGTRIFAEGAKTGQVGGPPAGKPPEVIAGDPAKQWEEGRQKVMAAFKEPGAMDKGQFLFGIAFVDSLIHGWDIAKGTGQDTTMPDDLAQAGFQMLDGKLDPKGSGHAFKPAVNVPDDARAQDKLLALTGREPS